MDLNGSGNGSKLPSWEKPVVSLPQVVVAVIVLNTSALLLGRDKNTDQWTLPKRIVGKFQEIQAVGQSIVWEGTGISVQIVGSIFVSEEIIPPSNHQIIVVTLGKPIGGGEALTPVEYSTEFSEIKWVDFRELGDIQDDVDAITADAIMKFGAYMQNKALRV
jgi:hypothetical protein